MPDPSLPTNAERVRLAAAAGCDPATVVRFFRGAPVRSTTRARIEAALAVRRVGAPSPTQGPSGGEAA